MSTKKQHVPLAHDQALITEPDPDKPWLAVYSYALRENSPTLRYARFATKYEACEWAKRIAPGWVGRNIMVMKVEACFINIGVVINYGVDEPVYSGPEEVF